MILTLANGLSEEKEWFEAQVLHGGVKVDVRLKDGRWLRGRVVKCVIREWMILQDDVMCYEAQDVAEVVVRGK
jgi:hypothetical protein